MRLTPDTSQTIDVLRFPLMVGVVAIHAASAAIATPVGDDFQVAYWIQWVISHALALVAVPMFFAMSALLLGTGHDGSWAMARAKVTSRLASLGRPFVLWCCIGAAILAICESVPFLASKMRSSGTPLADSPWFVVVDRTFGVTGGTPIAYQFWFIRDLMILILIHPFLLRMRPFFLWITWGGCVAWWLIWPNTMVVVQAQAAASFIGGLLLSRHTAWLDQLPNARSLPWFLVLAAISAMICMAVGLPPAWKVIFILSACPLVWTLSYCVRTNRILMWLGGFSFFLYCVHEPLLTVIRKLILTAIPPVGSWDMLAVYSVSGLMTIVIALIMAFAVSRWTPGLFSFITGGRSRPVLPPPGSGHAH